MSLPKIVAGVGIVAVLGYFLLGDKIKKIIEQFQNVKVVPAGFKNFNAKWNDGVPYVTFKLDLKMINQDTKKSINIIANITTVPQRIIQCGTFVRMS
ncbi:MAG: hypothetical protein ABI576_14125 [Flavobacterium sp.]